VVLQCGLTTPTLHTHSPWSTSRAFSLLLRSFDLAVRSFLPKKFRFLCFLSAYEMVTFFTPTKHVNSGNILHILVRNSVPENPRTPKLMTSAPLPACYRGHQTCKISSIFIWTVSGPLATRVDTDKGCWNTKHKFCENTCLQLKLNSSWCH